MGLLMFICIITGELTLPPNYNQSFLLLIKSVEDVKLNFRKLKVLPSRYTTGGFAAAKLNNATSIFELTILNISDPELNAGLICYKTISCYDTSKTDNNNPLDFLTSLGGDFSC